MKATLLYILEGDNVFLARKKRKIGAGLWNGYGGKIEEGDSPIESLKKEFEIETSGATLKEEYLVPSAIISFFNHDNVSGIPNFKVLVYRIFSDKCNGRLKESAEMGAPKLFQSDDLPYDEMLPPDKNLLPISDMVMKKKLLQLNLVIEL
jgi:8-oxo-dGTP diphosphatase